MWGSSDAARAGRGAGCGYSAAVRLAIALLLVIPGLLMLASPWLPLGVLLCGAGWWIYERSALPDRDGLATLMLTLGTIGAGAVVVQYARQLLG